MEVVDRVQELARVEALDDPVARETAQELLDAVLELYGDGLERIVAALDEAGARELRRGSPRTASSPACC